MSVVMLEIKDKIAYITLNRPEARNAINSAMCNRLSEILVVLAQEKELVLAVLTGAGQAFSAGADLREMDSVRDEAEAGAFFGRLENVLRSISGLEIPVLAAINGTALGAGLDLALAADMRISVDTAKFGVPALKLGLSPTSGLVNRLIRAVGPTAASWMIWSAGVFRAGDALRMGLVSEIWPLRESTERVEAIAEEYRTRSAPALRLAKQIILAEWREDYKLNHAELSAFPQ